MFIFICFNRNFLMPQSRRYKINSMLDTFTIRVLSLLCVCVCN